MRNLVLPILLMLATACSPAQAARCSPEAYSISKGGLGANLEGTCAAGEVPTYRADCEGFECSAGGVGPTGPAGADGSMGGLAYTFNTTVGGTPASGTIRLDNATLNAVSAIHVADLASDGANYSAVLNGVFQAPQATKGYIYLSDAAGSPTLAVYRVLSVTDQTGYVEFEALYEAGAGTAFGTDVVISFAPNGSDGGEVPASSTDNAIGRYDGTGGLLQNSTVTIGDTGDMTFTGSEDHVLEDLHCLGFDEPEALGTGSISFCSDEWAHDGARHTINMFSLGGPVPGSGAISYPLTLQRVDATTALLDWAVIGGDVSGDLTSLQIGSQKVGTTELYDGGIGTVDIDSGVDTAAVGECLKVSAGDADVFEWGTCGAGTDTTCLDAGVVCAFAGSATEGGAATSALTSTNADNLTLDPTDCTGSDKATGIDRQGDLTCGADDDAPECADLPTFTGDVTNVSCAMTIPANAVAFSELSGAATDAQVPDTITIDTATALAANPAACTGTDKYSDLTANGTSTCTADDDVPESGDFTNLTGGAGITVSAGTVAAASEEEGFITAGASALTCGAGTAGKFRVIPTGGYTYCDNAATPTLRYSTYGNGFGGANSVNVTDSGSDTTTWCNFSGAAATGTQGVVTDPGCTYNASTNVMDVGVTDGPIDNAPVGATTPSTGKFTTLTRRAGTSTGYGSSVINLYSSATAVGNVGAGTDDLLSFSVPANTLTGNGDFLRVTFAVKFAGNANNKTFNLLFGGMTMYSVGASAFNGTTLIGTTTLTWALAGTQQAFSQVNPNNTAAPWGSGGSAGYATGTETLTNALTIKGQGLSGSSATDDVKQLWMSVEYGSTP